MIGLIIQILLLSAILVMAFFCQRQNVQATERLKQAKEREKRLEQLSNPPKPRTADMSIQDETEPYVYDPNWVPDWSVHIDLARCTPTQLRILSELEYSLGNVKRRQAKNDENEAE